MSIGTPTTNPSPLSSVSPLSSWPSVVDWRAMVVAVCQILGVASVFYLFSAAAVPDVNEAHYWTKAKHFWDPNFCPGDLFLGSADAHWSFYVTLGQWTRVLPLEQAVWCGRWTVWLAMATGWWALTRVFRLGTLPLLGSAALLVVATRWGHLSGEWVVGGAEAKGLAFAWIFGALAAACSQRWSAAFALAGIAAGFHVLAGGWIVVCLLLVGDIRLLASWTMTDRLQNNPSEGSRLKPRGDNAATLLIGLSIGGLASLPGLVPALALTWGQPAEVNQAATAAYVLQRLPHHLVFWSFSPMQLCNFCLLLLAWLVAASGSRQSQGRQDSTSRQVLLGMVHASLLIAAIGVALSLAALGETTESQSAVRWLRYYWFRTADVLLPLGTILLLCQSWGHAITERADRQDARPSRPSIAAARSLSLTLTLAVTLAVTLVAWEGWLSYRQAVRDPRPNADKASLPLDADPARTAAIARHWQAVCTWSRNHTPPDAVFLTPRGQQTFKWYAHRSEVVSWKDVPQDSAGIAEWQQRVNAVAPLWSNDLGVAVADPVAVHELVERYGVTHILMTQYAYELQTRWGRRLPYTRVYPASAQERTYYVVLDARDWRGAP